MSEELRNRIIELKRQNLSWNEIAKRTGSTYNTVRGIYRRSTKTDSFSTYQAPTHHDETTEELIEKDKANLVQNSGYESLKKKYNALLRRENAADRILKEITPLLSAPPAFPSVYGTSLNQKPYLSNQDALLLMSCLHFGEVVDPENIMGLGEYNAEIAAARFQYYIENSINILENHHSREKIDKVWFVCVGDVISGNIHQELVATNQFPLGEQIVRAAYLLAYGIRDLASRFAEVEFVGLVGNHGRFEKKPYFKEKYNNADWLIYHMAKALVANQPNITMTIPKSPWWTGNIKGHNFFFCHGDQIRASNGTPFTDMKKFIGEMSQLLMKAGEEYPEYWGFGHFHTEANLQINHGEILMTGSVKGIDEHTSNKLRAGNSAMQLLAGVHEEKGVSFRYPILLEDANPKLYNRYSAIAEKEWNF